MTSELGPLREADGQRAGAILYGHPASGHSWKVRQALVLLGIPHRYVVVDILAPLADRNADFVAASPYGEVPTLVRGGEAMAQSNAILLALARETGRLGGHDPTTLERWLFWEANRIGFSLANLRWEVAFRQSADPAIAMLRSRTNLDLDFLDRHLTTHRFIAGERLSMADISCAAYVQFADEASVDLADRWHIVRWLDALTATTGWRHARDLMRESETWPAGQNAS